MDWAHHLIDTISYKGRASISDGDITYGSLATAAARIELYPSIVRGTGGEEVVTSHRVATQTDIPIESRVWVDTSETSDVSKSLRVLRREKAKMLDGHYTLYVLTLGR